MLDVLKDDTLDDLRLAFAQAAEAIVGPLAGKILVDKMPLNIVELGLINVLFPSAKVIVALRDPRDTCLSCFQQRFELTDSMVNFLDIQSTAQAYADVMGLWRHYKPILTLPVLEYRYEDLVADFDGTVGRILEFIGLPWDEAIQGYREAAGKRAIRTPSYQAVTAPVSAQAVGKWKAYEDGLAPVLPVLAPLVAAFGYD